MSSRPERVTPELLRDWPLPEPEGSKYGRGQVVVVGGASRSPGAAMLSGLAALRVGAGRLTLAVGASVAVQVAVAVPECGIVALDETPRAGVSGFGLAAAGDDLREADVVLVGPGLDDPAEARVMVRDLADHLGEQTVVILDAFALGVLRDTFDDRLKGRLVLTPNKTEAGILLGRDIEDLDADVAAIAAEYGAVVSCSNLVAAPDGRTWSIEGGGVGLATSGSGDVLAGAIAGLCGRGADPAQAAVWGTLLHAASGDRLAEKIAPVGYLARELLDELPIVLGENDG